MIKYYTALLRVNQLFGGRVLSDKDKSATFRAGVHPPQSKSPSKSEQIRVMPAPETVYISLSQHLGKPAVECVAVGETVKAGQKIASADGFISADVFSSVSGKVTAIAERETATGYAKHIVIENDGLNECVEFTPLTDPTPSEIKDRLRESGIVGMGGAGFPTAVKLSPQDKVDTFIINAAECEPYITCDYRIMLDYTEQFVRGAVLLAKAAGLNEVIIAAEDNKTDALEKVDAFIANSSLPVRTVKLKAKYPQGAEKQLIYAVTGRKVPVGKLPSSVGVLVDNVHTALSAYLAVTKGQPLYKRIMTVSGGGIKNPANIWVSGGTTYNKIIEFCGGLSEKETVKMISGGPMMGFAVDSDEISTTKTSSCLLLLTKDEAFTGSPQPCINCGKCAKACPMRLMPMYIDKFALAGDVKNAVKYGALNCIECGSCAYTCPAKRPLVQSIKRAKKRARDLGVK